MSFHPMADSAEGKEYSDVLQAEHPLLTPPPPSMRNNPRLEHYSTGRGDPAFPDMDVHLGMIFGMNSLSTTKQLDNMSSEMIHIRLKYLEDSNTVMQSRNQNLITENKTLNDQLRDDVRRIAELNDQVRLSQEELEQEKNKSVKRGEGEPRVFNDQGTSSATPTKSLERGVQAWAVCRGCQRKLEGNRDSEPTVTITKSELESLETDMQALRDAVVAREEAWDKAMEREQNYRQQLARLSAESVTSRHLSETRHSELESVTMTLTERELELKATQKDMLTLKKIIVKLEKRQRDFEENFDTGNAAVSPLMNDKEQKLVEDIVRRLPSAKSKQKPRLKGNNTERLPSSTPPSLQSSPRNARASGHSKDSVGAGSSLE